MLISILILTLLAVVLGIPVKVLWNKIFHRKKTAETLPSGKTLPEDRKLLLLSENQLATEYEHDDLIWIHDYVSQKREDCPKRKKKNWAELHRRLCLILHEYET